MERDRVTEWKRPIQEKQIGERESERAERKKCNTNVTSKKKIVIQMWHLDSHWKKKKITSRFPLKGKKSNFWDMDDESKSTKKLKRIFLKK